jgi:hypothetical protein
MYMAQNKGLHSENVVRLVISCETREPRLSKYSRVISRVQGSGSASSCKWGVRCENTFSSRSKSHFLFRTENLIHIGQELVNDR